MRSRFLIVLAVALVVLILGVALFRGDDMLTTLEFALILTVAAIPVAMPTVLSVTMAVGARLLAKKQAIVSRLASIEEMAIELAVVPARYLSDPASVEQSLYKVLDAARTVQQRNPEILAPVADFFNVDIEARLASDACAEGLCYESY